MKWVFAGGAAVFLAFYFIAEVTLDRSRKPGVVVLRWSTDDNPARQLQTATFAEMFPGLEAKIDPGSRQKLVIQCATGAGPDVIDVYNSSQMMSYVEAGILIDLTDYAKEMGFAPENTYPAVRGNITADGRQYRFPCNVWANCVIYNKAIFDDHGVPYPKTGWTYDDLLEIGRKIKSAPSKSGRRHIPVANWLNKLFFEDLLVGCGGKRFSGGGLVSALDSDEAVAAMQLYYDLMHVHGILTTPAEASAMSSQGGWGSGGINWFSTERAAMIFIGRWYLCQAPRFPKLKGKLGAMQLPRVGDRPSAGQCGTRAAGINVKSPHREEALKFLRYLASPEYSRLIVKDGDAMPPNPSLARTGADLVNDAVGEPEFHRCFIEALEVARPLDTSPFIDAVIVDRWMQERIGEVENKLATPEDAMRSLAKEINRKIRLNLDRRPDLQRKYEKLTGRRYSRDRRRERHGR